MKICILADSVSIHTCRWADFFSDQGHEVHVISKRYEGPNEINGRLHLIDKVSPDENIIANFQNYRYMRKQVKEILRSIEPDVVNAHYVSIYGILAADTSFRPFIVSIWGGDILRDPGKSRLLRFMISRALKKADGITTTAEFMKRYVVEEFDLEEEKIVRIPWGIDLRIFHQGYRNEAEVLRQEMGLNPNSKVILSNRNLLKEYCIETIVKAIPMVLEMCQDVDFLFIRGYGSKEYEDYIKDLCRDLKVEGSVHFISKKLTPREMAILANLSHAFISIPKTDQFGGTVMEAMVIGAIPIVSRIPVYGQYLEDGKNALYTDPEDPNELAEKIILSIEEQGIKESYHEINKAIIEENESWEKNARNMERLFFEKKRIFGKVKP